MAYEYGGGNVPPIQTAPQWLWDTSGQTPTVSAYPQGNGQYAITKTGLMPTDLQSFVGVPLQYYGNPPVAVDSGTMIQWLRWAEDRIEQETSLLLCQTWVASPPSPSPQASNAIGILVNSVSGYQVQGIDFDLPDAGYDFFFSRAQDMGWMVQILRYRPVQSVGYSPLDLSAIKRTAFIYPLLNQYFIIPNNWNVEDRDFGVVRYVPAVNVQMLPLFAMQLAFMGFTENVPGSIWLQYTAGLTQFDYQGRWSFVKRLVLAEASLIALAAVQGGINLGALEYQTNVDGLMLTTKYDSRGPYAGLIKQFQAQRDELMQSVKTKLAGPMWMTL